MTKRTMTGALAWSIGMVFMGPWVAPAEAITWNVVFDSTSQQPLVLVGVGDVDGDGISDLIWRNPATGDVEISLTQPDESFPLSRIDRIRVVTITDLNWEIAGVGDLNGDRREDLVWVNRSTQQIVVWIMNGTSIESSYFLNFTLPPPPIGHRWKLLAVKDISGNGQGDLVWVPD